MNLWILRSREKLRQIDYVIMPYTLQKGQSQEDLAMVKNMDLDKRKKELQETKASLLEKKQPSHKKDQSVTINTSFPIANLYCKDVVV